MTRGRKPVPTAIREARAAAATCPRATAAAWDQFADLTKRIRTAQTKIRETGGAVIIGVRGGLVRNPWCNELDHANIQMRLLLMSGLLLGDDGKPMDEGDAKLAAMLDP